MLALTRKFLGHVLPGVARPLHILWNQVIGFLFLVLAALPVKLAVQSYKAGNIPHFLLSAAFVLFMGWFGISSFWRARKISRS